MDKAAKQIDIGQKIKDLSVKINNEIMSVFNPLDKDYKHEFGLTDQSLLSFSCTFQRNHLLIEISPRDKRTFNYDLKLDENNHILLKKYSIQLSLSGFITNYNTCYISLNNTNIIGLGINKSRFGEIVYNSSVKSNLIAETSSKSFVLNVKGGSLILNSCSGLNNGKGIVNLHGDIEELYVAGGKYDSVIIKEVNKIEKINLEKFKVTNLTIANFITYSVRLCEIHCTGLILANLENDSKDKGEIIVYDNEISILSLKNIPFNKWCSWLPLINKGYKFFYVKNRVDELGEVKLKWTFAGLLKNYLVVDLVRYSESCSIHHLKELFKEKNDSINLNVMEAYGKRAALKKSKLDFRLLIAYISNYFGLSILRALAWIIILIVAQYEIFIYLSDVYCFSETNPFKSNGSSISHLISPVHKTSLFTDLIDENCVNFLELKNKITWIDNLFRIAIGYAIFQFISAYRYKYNLK
jgi:hypothetical protein